MVCQILDALYIHPLPYLSDPTDPMTCLRPDLLITPNPFGVATPGLGTPDLLSFETSCKIDKQVRLIDTLIDKQVRSEITFYLCVLSVFSLVDTVW